MMFQPAKLQNLSETTQNYKFRETTFRGYSGHLRTLNVERLLFSPLRGLTVVTRSAVLNGILQKPPLNATTLMLPKLIVLLLQRAALQTDGDFLAGVVYGFDIPLDTVSDIGDAERAVLDHTVI